MTVAELALRKICEFSEDTEKEILKVKLVKMGNLVPQWCEAKGDVLTLGFSDGTKIDLTVQDCNVSYDSDLLMSGLIVSEDIMDHNGKYLDVRLDDC